MHDLCFSYMFAVKSDITKYLRLCAFASNSALHLLQSVLSSCSLGLLQRAPRVPEVSLIIWSEGFQYALYCEGGAGSGVIHKFWPQ